MINALFVLILAIPLGYFLFIYSFEVKSYDLVQRALNTYAAQSEKGVVFENVKVETSADKEVEVQADALLPNSSSFTYLDNEELLEQLRRVVGEEVTLNLRIQNVFEPVSKDQQDDAATVGQINEIFLKELSALDQEYRVSSINVAQRDNTTADWNITAEVLADPDSVPLSSEVETLRARVAEKVGKTVDINVTFLPRLTLRSSDQTLTQSTRERVTRATSRLDRNAEISSYSMILGDTSTIVTYTITTIDSELFDEEYLDDVEAEIRKLTNKPVQIRVKIIEAQEITN